MQYMLTDYAKELKETKGIDATPVKGTEHSACWDLKLCNFTLQTYSYDLS